ncbi:hypothetical protein T492DRAFT_877330 [Pavlovales sp. CCMP2436]|nr:hypothetical protein T492DRAFT_877330 [Pavlovales sp. CCMP2436]
MQPLPFNAITHSRAHTAAPRRPAAAVAAAAARSTASAGSSAITSTVDPLGGSTAMVLVQGFVHAPQSASARAFHAKSEEAKGAPDVTRRRRSATADARSRSLPPLGSNDDGTQQEAGHGAGQYGEPATLTALLLTLGGVPLPGERRVVRL